MISTGTDAGGVWQFLDGKALHCGTPIELYLPEENRWVRGRYECEWRDGQPIPLFVVNQVGTMLLAKTARVRRTH